MNQENLILQALNLTPNAIAYFVGKSLAERFPDKALLEGSDGLFNVYDYAQAGQCMLTNQPDIYNQIVTYW